MGRSEEQIVAQEPIKLIFGGKEYQVKPLVIKDSRVWRKKIADMLGNLPSYVNATTDQPEQFQEALTGIMVDMPDKVCDLVFDYARDLPRKEVEAVATDAEMAKAFESILEVAFPLAQSIAGATMHLAGKKNISQ